MDPSELLRIVDAIHRDKNIDKEIVFEGIEAALVSAAKKHYGEEADIVVQIDRTDGSIRGTHNGVPLDPAEMAERIGAQTAKQVMIQKIREAERDALFDEYDELTGQLVTGVDPALRRRRGHRHAGQRRGHPAHAASRSPAKRTTPTSACGPPSTKSARPAAA